MSEILHVFKKYSIKQSAKIKSICAPLAEYLNIPVFTYCSIEADGRFVYLSNTLEFNEYYFTQNYHTKNPYYANPVLFQSGHAMLPCTFDSEELKALTNRFKADHFFMTLHAEPSKSEMFIFANLNESENHSNQYMNELPRLNQFAAYFKREAKDLIGKMRAEKIDIRTELSSELFETPSSIPLAINPKADHFLKKISGLSTQERRCLLLFKEGKSAQATAALMGLSQRTVEHYFENIKNKLGCNSKYDLLKF